MVGATAFSLIGVPLIILVVVIIFTMAGLTIGNLLP